MNYWVLALHYNWASSEMVKQAIHLKDCSPEDLQEGIEKKLITAESIKRSQEKPFRAFLFCLKGGGSVVNPCSPLMIYNSKEDF